MTSDAGTIVVACAQVVTFFALAVSMVRFARHLARETAR